MLCLLVLFKLWLCCWFFEIKRTGQTENPSGKTWASTDYFLIHYPECLVTDQDIRAKCAKANDWTKKSHIWHPKDRVGIKRQTGKKKVWHALAYWVSSNFAHNGQQINDMRGHVDTQTESIYIWQKRWSRGWGCTDLQASCRMGTVP